MGFDIFKRWSLIALLASSLVAADAFAQRGERGGRGGGGRGGGGGGERSASESGRGGGRGGGEARSMSRGSSRGQSARSSRGPDVSRGRPSGRGSFDAGRSAQRSFQGRSAQREDAGRQFDGRQLGRQQPGRSQQFDRSQLDRSQRQTFQSRDLDGARSARSQPGGGRREYEARRPTSDEVGDFLRLRRDGQRQAQDFQRRDQDFRDRDFRQGREGDRDRVTRDPGRRDFERQFGEDARRDLQFRRDGGEDRRRELSDRIGDRAFRDRDFRDRDFGDRDFGRRYERWRDTARFRDGDRRGDFRDWSGRWREGDRFARADRIRNRWRDRDWDDLPFRAGWWDNRNWGGRRWDYWGRWSRNRPWYWWAAVAAPRLFGHFDYGWRTPYYWDYGPGEYIYYDDGVVYVNGRWYQPGPVFYDQTVELVEQAPELDPEEAAQMEWLPLGVFAVTRDGQAEADVLVQLAVTQDGVLGGTAFDQQSSDAYPVSGIVEKETQRAVWSFTDNRNQRIVMETSIFNLTQPEATGLVHYGPDSIRVIQLVRLEPPEGTAVATEGELPAPPTY